MKFRIDKQKEKLVVVDSTRIEYFQLKQNLTRHIKNYRFNPKVKLGIWDGKISHFNDGSIDWGLWKEIFKMCQEQDWKFELENKEDFPINKKIEIVDLTDFCHEFFKHHTLPNGNVFMPYDYQIDSAYKIMRNRYCVTEVATGGGKSLIFSVIAFYILSKVKPDAKILLIVPSISLVTQFYDDIIDYNKGFKGGVQNPNPLDIRMCEIMSDKPRRDEGECNIYIGTYQSLEKRPDIWFKQFNIVTADEAHSGGQGTSKNVKQVAKVLKNTRGSAYMRFGMSGTFPKEETIDWLTIQSLLGPKISTVRADDLMKRGVITPVQIKALIINHNDPEFNDNIAMVKKGGGGKACFDLERKYVHESTKRLDFITDKLLSNITKNSLVLFNIKDYGKKIYNQCRERLENVDIYYIDGDTPSKKRDFIKDKLKKDGIKTKIGKILGDPNIKDNPKVLVASFGTLSTGISVPSLENVIFMESFKSEQIIIQSVGRILRLYKGKDLAKVFDIVDVFDDRTFSKNILYKHFEERRKFYKDRGYPLDTLKINL